MCGGKSTSGKIKGKSAIAYFLRKHLLKICFAIGIFDLAHALYFVIQATISLVLRFDIYSTLAVLGTIFWVLIVILLIVGLWKRRPLLVKAWLVFSIGGFITDIGFLIWGIASSIKVNWDRLQRFTIIFVGIFIESLCIYIVHCFYIRMDPCRLVDVPDKSDQRKKRKKKVDAKACKADKSKNKSNKSSTKSDKKNKKKQGKK
ncbi:uncharacterized protein LOC116806455 [Drosophila grimshawi]|uniref:uncharacterized protein LOC116806455 n=1 Tax=Drosophila grimshawi TaxID=7222 RepID=UPI000C87024D|nr:uncharacterized protein LOC116806455 [Drosophila grimshawi]